MDFVIYGDVLVVTNFIINSMVLRLCGRFCGVKAKSFPYIMGAFLGALCSFSIFLPAKGMVWDVGYRLVTAGVVVRVAYGRQPLGAFGKLFLAFFLVNFLVAGVVIALWFLFPSGGYAYRNGAVYFHIRPIALVLGVTVAYCLGSLFSRVFRWRRTKEERFLLRLQRGDGQVTLTAMADTGNRLREPFSGLPVVVANFSAVEPLLTPEEQRYILTEQFGDCLPGGLRMVAFRTVEGEGILSAFSPDCLEILLENQWREVDAYVGVSVRPLAVEGCTALFHPEMIKLWVCGGG